MSKIITNPEKVLTLGDVMGGWGKDLGFANGSSIPVGKGQYGQSSAMSPFRRSRIGDISPGESFSAVTDSGSRVTALPLNGTSSSNGKGWVALRNNRLCRLDLSTPSVDANYDPTCAAPNHAGHVLATTDNVDVIAYKDGSAERIAMSWEDDNDADIMRINADASGQDDDWFSTLTGSGVLTKGVPHIFGRSGVVNLLHITNGQYIATADVVAGTGNPQHLNLGAGWVATSCVRYGNFLAIVGYQATLYATGFYSSFVRVWLWQGVKPDPDLIYDIPDNYATKIENVNGNLVVTTQGKTNTTKQWVMYPGSGQFVPVWETQQAGNAPRHGGGTIFENMYHWVSNAGAYVNVLDFSNKGAFGYPGAFHQRTQVANATDLGMMKELTGGGLFVGHTTSGPAYGISKLNLTGYVGGKIRFGLQELGFKGRALWFKFYFSSFTSGLVMDVALMKNDSNEAFGGGNDVLRRQLTYATLGGISEYMFRQEVDMASSFYLSLQWNSFEFSLRRIEIGVRNVSGRG